MKKIYKRLKKIFSRNKDMHSEKKLGEKEIRIDFYKGIKYPSSSVIELARKFKNNSLNNENIHENNSLNPNILIDDDNLYIRFEKFILDRSDKEKLPSQYEIEKFLGITEHERKRLIKKGQENGLILKKNKTTNILNINYVEEGERNVK